MKTPEVKASLGESYLKAGGNAAGPSCLECGAPSVAEMDCRRQFEAVLAWEASDPELLAAHFLTVASYNLQHPAQFEAEALAGLRAALLGYLDGSLTIAQIRKRGAAAFNGPKRVLKKASARRPRLRRWRLTIADVFVPDHPESAAGRVRAWADAIGGELRGNSAGPREML